MQADPKVKGGEIKIYHSIVTLIENGIKYFIQWLVDASVVQIFAINSSYPKGFTTSKNSTNNQRPTIETHDPAGNIYHGISNYIGESFSWVLYYWLLPVLG